MCVRRSDPSENSYRGDADAGNIGDIHASQENGSERMTPRGRLDFLCQRRRQTDEESNLRVLRLLGRAAELEGCRSNRLGDPSGGCRFGADRVGPNLGAVRRMD
jgi:hypothetical protein